MANIGISIHFLKICEGFHYLLRNYGLKNYIGIEISLHDVVKVVQVCFDVNVYILLDHVRQIAQTKSVYANV